MEELLKKKNESVADIKQLLIDLEIVNFKGNNTELHNLLVSEIQDIEKYNIKKATLPIDNKDKQNIKSIISFVIDHNEFVNTLLSLISNIKKIEIQITKIDTSGSQGTITPTAFSKLESVKDNIINNLYEIHNTLLQFSLVIECKNILLDQFNKAEIPISEIENFITELNKIYISEAKTGKSKYIISFIYEVYNSLFYYISGKKNQKIISEYILKHLGIIKSNLLKEYEETLPQGKNSLLKLSFTDNSKYNIPQKLIQTNNLNPVNLYDSLENIFKKYLNITIPNVKSNDIVNDKKLFNSILKLLSDQDTNANFIIFYKPTQNPIEQQIISIVNANKKYINYMNSGINNKILNDTNTIKYIQPLTSSEETSKCDIKIYKNPTPTAKNIYYILDTLNNKEFRFLSPWNYNSGNVKVNEIDIQFLLQEKYPKKNIEIYNNIINEKISSEINELIDTDILLNIDTDFINDYRSKILGNLKNIVLPYITKFDKRRLLSEIKNKDLCMKIVDYIVELASDEFENYIFNQKELQIKKDVLTYYFSLIYDMKRKYYLTILNLVDTVYKDKIIELSRSSYYSNSSVLSLYYSMTNEAIKNFVSIRHGIFILIKQKIELNNIINESFKK